MMRMLPPETSFSLNSCMTSGVGGIGRRQRMRAVAVDERRGEDGDVRQASCSSEANSWCAIGMAPLRTPSMVS